MIVCLSTSSTELDNEPRTYTFLSSLKEEVPARCNLIEYGSISGMGELHQASFNPGVNVADRHTQLGGDQDRRR